MLFVCTISKSFFKRSSESGACCFNYYKNKNGHCIQCPFGTFGSNCSGLCPSGYYGMLCQEICSCEEDICDREVGCPPQTDWSIPSSPTSKSVKKILPTGMMSSSYWKNTLFTVMGSIGTIFAIMMMYAVKKWFIKMKARGVGSRISISENTLGNNITLRYTNNESIQNVNPTNSYTGLLVANRAIHEEKLRNITPGTRLNINDEPYKENKVEITENKTENLDNEYQDAWSDENFIKIKTLGETSGGSNLTSSRMNNGVNIKIRPYSSVKYNRKNNVREAAGEMNSVCNNIGDTSRVGDENQGKEEDTKTDFVVDFGGMRSGKEDASPEFLEYEDLNVLMAVQPEHYTDLTFPNENSYSEINKNREIKERKFCSNGHLYEAENIVESTEMYTVPNFSGRESILNEDSSATNSKEDNMFNEGETITEENWSLYEDVAIF
ncbi:uncharacterized protein LOC134262052 isoform X2 [Saccostrea cucullata]|uniref:uncharacterized protein LOC134262052 isoform X2 n=1 Tax=Saccostrea cuccullata TaxID=36930 RepID=UPI002ED4B5DC